ncbi:unnamed protein product [Notodromas monacha]|uniref:Uncharacterized protein n=1 Tax=Notodromas monacha TaxID=399045 RepID=A0A7R9BQ52_9CRUS|nr:unnamed protein product [Notodromas monacha]CAG0918260.1 unnamed protein product [Notodromas monacha]
MESGDCISTFKVGEDRFLNSLVVSENGKICVCGDETQKPFPLLVWDLEKRKLVFDLRIPHHEFLTHLMAITKEGHYVACACEEIDGNEAMFIVVYDLQNGTQFKRLKPGKPMVALAISNPQGHGQTSLLSPSRSPHSTLQALVAGSLGPSGRRTSVISSPISATPPLIPLSGNVTPTPGAGVLQYQEPRDPYVIASRTDASILIWDLITGSLKWTLRGHTVGPDMLRVTESGERLFSYNSKGHDPTLRLWSLVSGTSVASFTPDHPFIDCCHAVLGSRTVVYASASSSDTELEENESNIVSLLLANGSNWQENFTPAPFGSSACSDVVDIHFTLPQSGV